MADFGDAHWGARVKPATANGRIDLLSPMPAFDVQDGGVVSSGAKDAPRARLDGNVSRGPVADLFFSADNVEALQQGIRYRVYVESGNEVVVGRQSDAELAIIMRSTYWTYGRNAPDDVVGQVRALNARVLDYAVPEVLSAARMHERYRRDVSTLPVPMDRPTLDSKKGSRQGEFKGFF